MKKLNISVIIFTTNSETVVERAIRSVSFADEVIVYDIGSTDYTVKRAKKLVTQVIEKPYLSHVEPARQDALSYTKHEWVFFLDADEELPKTMPQVLEGIMKSHVVAARVPRKNMMFGSWMKHTGYWPDYNVRFFKKSKIEWHAEIHSNPTVHGETLDLALDEGNAIIHHHYASIAEYIEKLNRYTTVQAKESPDDFVWQSLLAKPSGDFLKRFFAWEGYLDGIHGLAASLLSSMYVLAVELKKWELKKFAEPKDIYKLADIRKEFLQIRKELLYWMGEAALKRTKNLPKKILLRIRQRILTR